MITLYFKNSYNQSSYQWHIHCYFVNICNILTIFLTLCWMLELFANTNHQTWFQTNYKNIILQAFWIKLLIGSGIPLIIVATVLLIQGHF